MNRIWLRTALLATLCLLLVAGSSFRAQGSASPAVLPPDARVQGMTLGQWTAQLWHDGFAIPASESPFLYPGSLCYFSRNGNVGIAPAFFFSGESECSMPAGMMLYVMVLGGECSSAEPPPFYGDNYEDLSACASQYPFANLAAEIDGLPVPNIERYLAYTPLIQLDLPADNVLGAPAGNYISAGYAAGFIMTPLSPGQHTVHVHGEVPLAPFTYDWVFHITVTN